MNLEGSSTASSRIRPYADPGLATCLDERRLCIDGSPIPVSRLDVEALALSEWAFARGRVLVLCPADPLAPLSALIAGAVHVADMASHYRQTGQPLGSSKRVAVVTTDYHARGLYRGLGIRPPRGLGAAKLRDVVPPATLGRDGVVRVLGADLGRGWSTVFVSSVADLKHVGDVDLVVADLPVDGDEGLLDLGTPVVAVARDPADPVLTLLGNRALIVGWGDDDLRELEGDGLPARIARRVAGSSCEIVAIPAHSVCENAALFWQDVGALIAVGRRSAVTRELTRDAFGLFYDLMGLALPLAVYESMTVPVRARLDAIGSAARLTKAETRDLYLPMVEAELRDLAIALGEVPQKHDVLIRQLGELVDDHADVMVVARTAEMGRAYAAELLGRPGLRRVRVVSLGALGDEAPADVALLTGMAPTWARWVYRTGIAGRVRVLAYTPEGPLESVARGFDEVEIVRRVVAEQKRFETWYARPAAKVRAWAELSGERPVVASTDDAGGPPPSASGDVPVLTVGPADVPPGLWDGRGWLAPLEPAAAEGLLGVAGMRLDHGADVVVAAVKVTFEDGRWALLGEAGTVTRYRPGSGDADAAYPVARLKPGDQVLFFDGDSRKDLLAKVLEVAVEIPALAVAAGWVAHWRRVLAAAYRRFGSYEAFADALRSLGCSLETQSIRLWVIGVTIGPNDEEDVRRVGLVTEDAALLGQHQEICRAMRSLRGAHMRLGRRLTEVARHVGPAAAGGRLAPDEVVDERSGLTAADFQDSVDILTVRAIEPVGDMPYVVVGRLNDEELEGFDV